MIPSVDDRLDSVIRALSDVVLSSLPPEAGLAQEQVQLALGHLQILRAQLDGSVAFEADELADTRALGAELAARTDSPALGEALTRAEAADDPAAIRSARIALRAELAGVIASSGPDQDIAHLVIAAETRRVAKDRAWFAPFGFDTAPPSA